MRTKIVTINDSNPWDHKCYTKYICINYLTVYKSYVTFYGNAPLNLYLFSFTK